MPPAKPNPSLLSTVRHRNLKMIKNTLENVSKLNETSDENAIIVWKEDLNDKWAAYSHAFEAHEECLISLDDDIEPNLKTITDEFIGVHTEFISAKLHVHKLLSTVRSTNNGHNSTFLNEHTQKTTYKLPPVRITPFAGDSADWIEFKATCSRIMTEDMPEFQRLQLLKDALIGEPRNIIGYVLPGEGAYDKAFELLRIRYENFRTIVNAQLRKFCAIPRIETPSASVFRSMSILTNGLLATLHGCNIGTENWDAILIFLITQKFDAGTLEAWEEKLEGNKNIPPLQTLLDFLNTRIAVRTGMDDNFPLPSQNDKIDQSWRKSPARPNPFMNHKRDTKVRSFYTLKPDYQCALCEKNHLPSRCNEIVNIPVKERHTLIRQKNLCFNCFYPHQVKDCPFNPACKKCKEAHHTLLHFDNPKMYLTCKMNLR